MSNSDFPSRVSRRRLWPLLLVLGLIAALAGLDRFVVLWRRAGQNGIFGLARARTTGRPSTGLCIAVGRRLSPWAQGTLRRGRFRAAGIAGLALLCRQPPAACRSMIPGS